MKENALSQTSKAAKKATDKIYSVFCDSGQQWQAGFGDEVVKIIQSAIDAEDEGWLRKFEKIEQKFGPFDAAARVEPTKKYNRLTNLDIDNNRLRFRLLESNAALEVAYKFGLSKRLESVGEIIDKNNEELNASCAPKTQDENTLP